MDTEIPGSGSVRLKLPSAGARRWASTRLRPMIHEPDLASLLDAEIREDDLFLDGGAHFGVYTALARQRGADVIAVDVDQQRLKVAAAHRGGGHLQTVAGALADRGGVPVTAAPVKAQRPSTTMVGESGGSYEVKTVTTTIDMLSEECGSPDVVKLDMKVQSSPRSVARQRPWLAACAVWLSLSTPN